MLANMPNHRDDCTIKTALISVSDKTGVVELAQALSAHGIRLLSTGGTAKVLLAAGLSVTAVSEITGQAEIMDGRVKTLHPKIHAGLLGRRDLDADIMLASDIKGIDLLVVNLYPFTQTITQPGCSFNDAIEQIDIGGPAMLRAACKNHQWVTVLTNPADYQDVINQLPLMPAHAARQQLALKGFRLTSAYDAAISNYLQQQLNSDQDDLPAKLTLNLEQVDSLRYGENPQQEAAFYCQSGHTDTGFAAARQHQGKPLSYNNLMDADAAWSCLQAIASESRMLAACVIVKHANPCGVACAATLPEAYQRAFACDSISAFGGIIAVNSTIDDDFARQLLNNQFLEVLLAPEIADSALPVLAEKPNIRVLSMPTDKQAGPTGLEYRRIDGGYLVQQADHDTVGRTAMSTVTDRPPSEQEWEDLLFAWQLVRFVKSNAVVYARDHRSLGIGAGQMSRIDSARIAVVKADDAQFELAGCAMASEAFFPFRDSIDQAHAAGVTAIIQPGGSMRDQEVIDAANEHRMTMVFTGQRHFRH